MPAELDMEGRGLPGREVGALTADSEPAEDERVVLELAGKKALELEALGPLRLADGTSAPAPSVVEAPVTAVPDAPGSPVPVPPVEAGAPESGAIDEPDTSVLVGAADPDPIEPEASGVPEVPELGDPECRALR